MTNPSKLYEEHVYSARATNNFLKSMLADSIRTFFLLLFFNFFFFFFFLPLLFLHFDNILFELGMLFVDSNVFVHKEKNQSVFSVTVQTTVTAGEVFFDVRNDKIKHA